MSQFQPTIILSATNLNHWSHLLTREEMMSPFPFSLPGSLVQRPSPCPSFLPPLSIAIDPQKDIVLGHLYLTVIVSRGFCSLVCTYFISPWKQKTLSPMIICQETEWGRKSEGGFQPTVSSDQRASSRLP